MNDLSENKKNDLYYPPGGILIWLVIIIELITFSIGILSSLYIRSSTPEMIGASHHLNQTIGSINTIILLTSGYFMARSVEHFIQNKFNIFKRETFITIIIGLLFIILKTYEYYEKYNLGLTLGESNFLNFYWLMTGFHVIHVLLGIIILSTFLKSITKIKLIDIEDLEAGAAFWHMCDLIWLLIFPIIYFII